MLNSKLIPMGRKKLEKILENSHKIRNIRLSNNDLIVEENENAIGNDLRTEDNGENDYGLEEIVTSSDEDENYLEGNTDKIIKSKYEKIKDEILKRYQERHGKQLYIRFPHKVPESEESLEKKVKELAPLIVKVHKPRQRHARFCLVDFATQEDRDAGLESLKKLIEKGILKKYAVNIPRTESTEFVNLLVTRKIKSVENKKARARLKRESKRAVKGKHFTSSVIIQNLPKATTILQMRELFVNAVDIQIKPCKGKLNKDKCIAAVTLPTTMDARKAIKNKLSLGGNQLVIRFDNRNFEQKSKISKNITNQKDIKRNASEPKQKISNLESKNIANNRNTKINKKLKNTEKKNN